MSAGWGYTEENGPAQWFKQFPQASGHRQSPVNINTTTAVRGRDLAVPQLRWKYVPENSKSLVNPGYCWRVDVNGESELSGGPLNDNIYKLEQFHCHWGCGDSKGSEHTVDGVSYAGELHLVHWNTTKYKTFDEAAQASDGLAVLGVFLKASDNQHAEIEKITSLLQFVQHKGDRVTIPNGCDPAKLLPTVTTFWTYAGSLTTPPCSECVTWIVFKTPIEVSRDQLDAMRNLNCYDVKEECPCNELNGKVMNNFRPPLPLGNRELREIGEH